MKCFCSWSSLRHKLSVHPSQDEGAAGVPQVSVQEQAWFGRVAVAVIEAEVSALQLPEQAEPIADHRGLVSAHLKPRPVQVQLQQQQADGVQHLLQNQVLQNLPLCAFQVHLQDIHLRGAFVITDTEVTSLTVFWIKLTRILFSIGAVCLQYSVFIWIYIFSKLTHVNCVNLREVCQTSYQICHKNRLFIN